jgi:hypothetical protein
MGMRSDGSGSPWNSVDDVWRTMSDPTPPRLSDYSAQAESSLNFARVNRAGAKAASLGVQQSIATVSTQPQAQLADPSETRLWRIAGALMICAVAVLGVLGWLTFAPGAASAAAAIVHPEPVRAPDPSRPHVSPLVVAAAASEPAAVASAKKERPNKHHGKQKAHKRGRVAKRR